MFRCSLPIRLGIALWIGLFSTLIAQAQSVSDTTEKVAIQIIKSDILGMFTNKDQRAMQRLVGDVQLKQADNFMFCDSAHLDMVSNYLFAYGNVRIVQPNGTTINCDYLEYRGNQKMGYAYENVVLTNGKDILWTHQLDYNLNTKIGTYSKGGTLNNGATAVTSYSGVYHTETKEARFISDVYISNPEYEVYSEDIKYNTVTEFVQFLSLSTVVNNKSTLVTKGGTYDAKKKIGDFIQRSSIRNKELYVEANKLYYSEVTGFGNAEGDVIAIDTQQKITLYSEWAKVNEHTGEMWSWGWPVLKKTMAKDSLFMAADSFYSAPVSKLSPTDSLVEQKRVPDNVLLGQLDTIENNKTDTTEKRYFRGHYNVRIFADSLQGICDSIEYTELDSIIRMMRSPYVWSRDAQISGDSIFVKTDSTEIKYAHIPKNPIMISEAGPLGSDFYDQIQGDTLMALFVNGTLDNVDVWPNAESIYYSKDESGAYIGASKGQAVKMNFKFLDNQMHQVRMFENLEYEMVPLKTFNHVGARLSRFKLMYDKRPQSMTELFIRVREQ